MSMGRIGRKGVRRYRRKRLPLTRQQVKAVRAIAQTQMETKKFDTTIAITTAVAGTGVVQLVSGVAVGDTDILREGNMIIVKSIQFSGTVVGDADVTFDTVCRIMLVRTVDCTGTNPSIANDILESDDPMALRDWDHRKDHQVLWNKNVTLPMRSAAADAVIPVRTVKFYKKFKKGLRIWYDGVTGAVTDATRNHLFLVFINNQAASYQPNLNGTFRVTFKD